MAKRQPPTPTPTLAQLRKEAVRVFGKKFSSVRIGPLGNWLTATVWLDGGFGIIGWMNITAPTSASVKSGLFAALRALPDKEGPRG